MKRGINNVEYTNNGIKNTTYGTSLRWTLLPVAMKHTAKSAIAIVQILNFVWHGKRSQ